MIAEVIVDVSASELDRVFDYEGGGVREGDRVLVEFGRKKIEGFVTGLKEKSEYPELKPILEVLEGGVKPPLLNLMRYMVRRYNLRYADVLRLFIPSELRSGKVSEQTEMLVSLNPAFTADEITASVRRGATAQLAVVEYLKDGASEKKSVLNAKFGSQAVSGLTAKGLLAEAVKKVSRIPYKTAAGGVLAEELTAAQKLAAAEITAVIGGGGGFLLHGVTGSGKTEVYMSVIDEAVKAGKTAIFLVPEISLTPQVMGLMRAKFGDNAAILHSGLSQGERLDEWLRLYRGEAKIAVGARSAVFAPLENLGAVVVDEEHDSSYISESNPRYNAKEVAEFRAKNDGAAIVFGSATPDIESYLQAERGGLKLIELKTRVTGGALPDMEIIDMVSEFRSGNRGVFSLRMKECVEEVLKRGEQAMIFINRRGYASFVMCRECGFVAKCTDCDVSLTYHKEDGLLKCHYCGKRFESFGKCPVCGSAKLREGRLGTETVVAEIRKLFPSARTLRMDNDTTAGKDAHYKILSRFGAREADILVGTQMIAKGHDFGNVTLVCILDADSVLYYSDYRSTERVFQLVTQVAGRAGRSDKPGRVLLQTMAPRHYVFRYAKEYDYTGFFKKECNSREVTKFPPFSKIVRVLVSSPDEADALETVKNVYKEIKAYSEERGGFIYLQAMKSPVKRIQQRFRFQVLMRLENGAAEEICARVFEITDKYKSSKVPCFVEINPQSLV
ncbi:MAG: primosomal protein N' [Clostridiales bacterium]|nr:primosomal protein N' [Clostridiales bacterium]